MTIDQSMESTRYINGQAVQLMQHNIRTLLFVVYCSLDLSKHNILKLVKMNPEIAQSTASSQGIGQLPSFSVACGVHGLFGRITPVAQC